jgi:DNA invertase Pin-like site-specific DNA recombinase
MKSSIDFICALHWATVSANLFSRNLAFIATLMDSNVEFIGADNPHANRLTVHILAAVAEHERAAISERTKAALAAAKRRGVKLGGPCLAAARKASNNARKRSR